MYSVSCNSLQWKRIWKKKYLLIHMQMNHFVIHEKIIQHCKGTILQLKKKKRRQYWTSPGGQWKRIHLPRQKIRVWYLVVQEDSICHAATKPVARSYWSPRAWSPCSTREATAVRSPCSATEEQTLLATRENPWEAAKTWPSNASTKWHWTCRKGWRQAKNAERGEESPD